MEGRAHARLGLLLLLSILVHTTYLGAIFDIYFKSPVTQVDLRYGVGTEGAGGVVGEGLAKRVVLIVADGLRADKVFKQYDDPPFEHIAPLPEGRGIDFQFASLGLGKTTPAPFLRGLIQSGKAEWGVSHTRVPTESRPGHVSLIGGMYEDVSAVSRGWKTNPVLFDSVFNQSSHTFSFGSHDILPMFQLGASDPNRVDAWSYPSELEDFSQDAVHLDLWVLDHLRQLLVHNATKSPSLDKTVRAPGTVFFLHLIGLDSTGHSYRPHGSEYHRNLRVVDHIVQETVQLFESVFGDDETAFVFSADHGMSNLGNHGDGSPDNTRTPLITWGAGIGGKDEREKGDQDDYSRDWGLSGTRRDVEQADVAVLMSILAGLPIPANSAGRVPLDYLSASPSFKARAALANAKQILADFSARSMKKEAHAINFRPFFQLVDSPELGTKSISSHLASIQHHLESGSYGEAQALSMELVRIGLEGQRYFQTYDWLILRSIVAIGYLGFMIYSADFILLKYVDFEPAKSAASNIVAPIVGIIAFSSFATRFLIEKAPLSYYLYVLFPCFFWTSIFRNPSRLIKAVQQGSSWSSILNLAVVVGLAQIMVEGYSNRIFFSYILIAMGVIWPCLMEEAFLFQNMGLLAGWALSCLVLAVFPALPVEKGEHIGIILIGGFSFFVAHRLATAFLAGRDNPSTTIATTRLYLAGELLLLTAAVLVTQSSAKSLQTKSGLPLFNQVSGWVILISATLVPVFHGRPRGQPFFERLLILLLAFAPAFVILSLSYEALFYCIFSTTLCLWMAVECRLAASRPSTKGRITGEHLRIAVFFLGFLHVAFFGVGNVASISAFYLEPVYRLIPIFAPFPMALLLLFKLLIPFVALAAVTSVLNRRLSLPPFSLFVVASTLSDVLTINFFFRVTDVGSWLEIGSSITNFAICSLLSVFNTGLFVGGEAALAYTTVPEDETTKQD